MTAKEFRTACIDTAAFLAVIVFAIGAPCLPWASVLQLN
jgi:hypothetical protein